MLKIILIVVVSLFVLQQIVSKTVTNRTETPEYEILDTIGDVEIRKYPKLIMASTDIYTSGYSNSSNSGFRTVASYIFGGNSQNKKISMTSPVMMEMSDTVRMSFIMPSKYNLADLPDPENSDVYLHEENYRVVAVLRYGGFNNDRKYSEHKAKLQAVLNQKGIKSKGNYMFWGYNPPYELINRRNEVAVRIEWGKSEVSGLNRN